MDFRRKRRTADSDDGEDDRENHGCSFLSW